MKLKTIPTAALKSLLMVEIETGGQLALRLAIIAELNRRMLKGGN